MEERIRKLLSLDYESRIMIMDRDCFGMQIYDYERLLTSSGFTVIRVKNHEWLRFIYESQIKGSDDRYAIISAPDQYVPYDIRKAFYQVEIRLSSLYPRLNQTVLEQYPFDIEAIDYSYDEYYGKSQDYSDTRFFVEQTALSKQTLTRYIRYAEAFLNRDALKADSYEDWIGIARKNATISYYAAATGTYREDEPLNQAFFKFLMDGYQKLSSVTNRKAPSILPKTWDLIAKDKTALIVMDGMSMFDFEVFRRNDWPYRHEYEGSFALIPTITSVSRQSLIAGKYPSQLDNPFTLSREETEFYKAAEAHGFSKNKAYYGRGYDADPGPFARLVTIIVNDIDDMVHGQLQGRSGMLQEVTILSKSRKLQTLINRLIDRGFTVYITADHGNTECTGIGSLKRTGVETETKSKRMIVLKDFGEASEDLKQKTIQFPGYYLNKNYQYFICKDKTSFDARGKTVMTHGGMTVDEVIVPFIKITGEK